MATSRLACIVTGSARGIGRQIAAHFFSKGYNVCVADVDKKSAEAWISELQEKQKAGSNSADSKSESQPDNVLLFVETDVSSEESVKQCVSTAASKFRRRVLQSQQHRCSLAGST